MGLNCKTKYISLEIDFQLLSGTPLPVTQHMDFLADLAIEHLIANDADIEAAEMRLNSYDSHSIPISANDAMQRHLNPAKEVCAGSTILPFIAKTAVL